MHGFQDMIYSCTRLKQEIVSKHSSEVIQTFSSDMRKLEYNDTNCVKNVRKWKIATKMYKTFDIA